MQGSIFLPFFPTIRQTQTTKVLCKHIMHKTLIFQGKQVAMLVMVRGDVVIMS